MAAVTSCENVLQRSFVCQRWSKKHDLLLTRRVLTNALPFFSSSVCRDNYNRLCSLFRGYCQEEAYKYVKKHVVDRYRKNCPKTCGKCMSGQTMLDLSVYSKYHDVNVFRSLFFLHRSKETFH